MRSNSNVLLLVGRMLIQLFTICEIEKEHTFQRVSPVATHRYTYIYIYIFISTIECRVAIFGFFFPRNRPQELAIRSSKFQELLLWHKFCVQLLLLWLLSVVIERNKRKPTWHIYFISERAESKAEFRIYLANTSFLFARSFGRFIGTAVPHVVYTHRHQSVPLGSLPILCAFENSEKIRKIRKILK